MKRILVLGAGQSAPYMISYLLNKAEKIAKNMITASAKDVAHLISDAKLDLTK